jgi:hypothetical protein
MNITNESIKLDTVQWRRRKAMRWFVSGLLRNRHSMRNERTTILNQTGEIAGSTVMNDFGSNPVTDYNATGTSEYAARADHEHKWIETTNNGLTYVVTNPRVDHEIARVQGDSTGGLGGGTVDGRYLVSNPDLSAYMDFCLFTLSSTEPVAAVSHMAMLWYNITDGILYKRAVGNDGWEPIFTGSVGGGGPLITTTDAAMDSGEGSPGSNGVSRFGTTNIPWLKINETDWIPLHKHFTTLDGDAREGDTALYTGIRYAFTDGIWRKTTHIS